MHAERRRDGRLDAGAFGAWIAAMRLALAGKADAGVPCGDCCACCSTSHFVHIGPEERETLARVPRELLFPAPGMPAGHVLLPYDGHGNCPLLDGRGRCTIYAHRPLTCRTYDCRVFAAAGVEADRELITRRVRQWRFSCPGPADAERLAAVRAAAGWVRKHADAFPGREVPDGPADLAVLAVRVADVFLPGGPVATGADDSTTAAAVVRAANAGVADRAAGVVARATGADGRGPSGPMSPADAYRAHRP